MPELYKDNALTVGQLKKVLATLPDETVVGTACFDLSGHVEKADRLMYNKEHGILAVDHDRHNGSFSDEELDGFESICELDPEELG
jgi:hypothetical protein